MSSSKSYPRLTELLLHQEWLRRLARALVRDERQAEDLVQDTWVAAMEHPPEVPGGEKSWLRRVLIRQLGHTRRQEAARQRRERAQVERQRPSPAADELLERAELQQRVASVVFALDEPYRQTVLLRFFEGLAPREVAATMSVPVETVRTRLRRALARMRDALDEQDPDGASWRALLVPWLLPPASSSVPGRDGSSPLAPEAITTAGGLVMGTATKVAAGAAVLALLLASIWTATNAGSGPDRSTGTVSDIQAATDTAGTTSPAVDNHESDTANTIARHDFEDSPFDPDAPSVRVIVRTPTGEPLPGALVSTYSTEADRVPGDWLEFLETMCADPRSAARARTDDDGSVRLNIGLGHRWTVRADAPGYAVTGAVRGGAHPNGQLDLRLQRGVDLEGTIRDANDRPLARARIVGLVGGFSWSTDLIPLRVHAVSDASGRYRLRGLRPGKIQLFCQANGAPVTECGTILVPSISTYDVRLEHEGTLSGHVIDVDTDKPLPHCELLLGGRGAGGWYAPIRVRSDAQGAYRASGLPNASLSTRETRVATDDYVFVADPSEASGRLSIGAGQETQHDFRVRRAASVTGEVTSANGPISAATVRLHYGHGSTMVHRSARTDDRGRFRFAGVPETDALIEVIAEGWIQPGLPPRPSSAAASSKIPDAVHVDVPRTGTVTYRTELLEGSTCAGRVIDEANGRPIQDALVRMRGDFTQRETRTDEHGRFTLTGLRPDVESTIVVAAPRLDDVEHSVRS